MSNHKRPRLTQSVGRAVYRDRRPRRSRADRKGRCSVSAWPMALCLAIGSHDEHLRQRAKLLRQELDPLGEDAVVVGHEDASHDVSSVARAAKYLPTIAARRSTSLPGHRRALGDDRVAQTPRPRDRARSDRCRQRPASRSLGPSPRSDAGPRARSSPRRRPRPRASSRSR